MDVTIIVQWNLSRDSRRNEYYSPEFGTQSDAIFNSFLTIFQRMIFMNIHKGHVSQKVRRDILIHLFFGTHINGTFNDFLTYPNKIL